MSEKPYMQLRVPRAVYEARLKRMAEEIAIKAPAIIIYHEARLIQEAYRPSLWNRIQWRFTTSRLGIWWTLLFYKPPVDIEDTVADDLSDPDFLLALTPEQMSRFVKDIMEAPVVSPDVETQVLSCGHGEENWYSICSAHRRQDPECPRCAVGRCIQCHPSLPIGSDARELKFFNKGDGSSANPFPNLR